MENVSLLEDLGERQLKTEVRNGEISEFQTVAATPHHQGTFFSKYYYYYYFRKNFTSCSQ